MKKQNDFTTMKITWETKNKLDRWGRKGETYEEIIKKVLKILEDIEGAKPDFQTADKLNRGVKQNERLNQEKLY